MRRHSHDELSFGFVEGNSSHILCQALHFRMAVNQTILIPPDTVHLCQPDDVDQFIFKMIYIDPIWFSSAFGMDSRTLTPQPATLKPADLQVKNDFFSSFATFDNALVAESETLWFIGRLLFEIFDINEPMPQLTEDDPFVSSIKAYIGHHFTESIRLDDLADFSGKSKFSFLRKFKAAYKLTPHAYLLNKRINLAKQYLLQGESNAQTAALCGFFDQSHFIKTFRQYVGMNPMDYK